MHRVININREILKLAAERIGGNTTAEFPKLADWLSGGPYPTVKQLAEFSKAVHIPFGYFFLDKLPELKTGIPLFRTEEALPSENYSDELRDSIRIIQSRQEWLKEYLLNEGATPLPFVNSFNETDNPCVVAREIRKTLQLSDDWAGSMPNWESALKYLLAKTEEAGIYLTINGVVENNTHRPLNPDEFRGFALTDNYAPYIFINGKDFTAAKCLPSLTNWLISGWANLRRLIFSLCAHLKILLKYFVTKQPRNFLFPNTYYKKSGSK